MIRYLVDSSALWRMHRDPYLSSRWQGQAAQGAIGSCAPQRTEFRRSARSVDHYEELSSLFADLYPDVPVPKAAWRWIEAAQYRLLRRGAIKAFSVVDLLICATAAASGLVVLHDDNDFAAAARHLDDVGERSVHLLPSED